MILGGDESVPETRRAGVRDGRGGARTRKRGTLKRMANCRFVVGLDQFAQSINSYLRKVAKNDAPSSTNEAFGCGVGNFDGREEAYHLNR